MAKRTVGMIAFALMLALGTLSATAQQEQVNVNVNVSITGAEPGSLVEMFVNVGKVAEATVPSTGGDAMALLNMSNMGKIRVQIAVEVCVDGTTIVRMIEEGTEPPEDENCTRRRIGGFFWLDEAVSISIDLQTMTATVNAGGLSTTTKIGIGAAVAGGATVGIIAATGGDDPVATPSTTPPATTPPSTTPPAPVTPPTTPTTNVCTTLNITIVGSGTRTTDTCGGFSNPSDLSNVCTGIPTSGSGGSCNLTHTLFSVLFSGMQVTATQSGNVCTVTTTTLGVGVVGTTSYSSGVTITRDGETGPIMLTQTLTGPGGCTVVYTATMTPSGASQ